MDLSLLPTPVRESNKQGTAVRFTVRSANSPSYSLTHRSGVRKHRCVSVDEREGTEEVGGSERYGTNAGANVTNKDEDQATGYQARTLCHNSVKGLTEEKERPCRDMSPKLNQNCTEAKLITGTGRSENPVCESQGRVEWRRQNWTCRSKSLDWRTEGKKTCQGTRADKRGGDLDYQAEGLDEKGARADHVSGRAVSSIHTYNSAGTSNIVRARSPMSHMYQTLDRIDRGRSLPSRLRSLSGPGTVTATLEPIGGQSILERIEKLYGSAGFGKAEDYSKIKDPPHPAPTIDSLFLLQQRSYERSAGRTFPRTSSSGEKNSFSPGQGRTSITWTFQRVTAGSDSSLSQGRSRRLSGEQWQGKTQDRYSEEGGFNGFIEEGTRSLDRARSRNTVAAQIRKTFLTSNETVSLKDSSELKETKGINKTETDDSTKGKDDTESFSTDEDVFASNPEKLTLKTPERKKFSEMSQSVRNKISQFEALSQRAQGLATGQFLVPRRAMSVPAQLSHEGVKKSGSAKAIGGLRDKWEEIKQGGEVADKSEEKVITEGKKVVAERSLSMNKVKLRLRRKEERNEAENERKETDRGNNCAGALEAPLNGGAQRRRGNFYIDETDFSKFSSPEEASKKANNIQSPPPFNSSGTSLNEQKMTSPEISSPASDDDKTPTNTPDYMHLRSPAAQLQNTCPFAVRFDAAFVFTQAAQTPDPAPPPVSHPLHTSSHCSLPDLISPDVRSDYHKGKKQVSDLDGLLADMNSEIKVWDDEEDEDDDESTQKDEDSNYDSDSGESSVTITSNMSHSDRRSFCVSLSDLCNFAGVDYESENDSDEWQLTSGRSASLSSDVSALSYVSVMPSEELDKLLEDVRSLGDNTLQDYNDVQVVVLHKEVGVGLGFSVAGGMDQNKPVTVHKVFHSGVAAQEGSVREGDQVLSINGTALHSYAHWEALRVLRRAKTREMGVVVLRRGGVNRVSKGGVQTNKHGTTETQFTETGEQMCVRLEKNSRDLGFSLEGGVGSSLGNRPLTVQKIFQGGPVDKVCPGDEVLEIEGVSMVGMRRLEAWTLIRKLPPGSVDVVLRRPPNHL